MRRTRRCTLWLPPVLLLAGLAACSQSGKEQTPPAAPSGIENGSFTASLNGFEIHYEVHGTGPVMMTLPNSWGLSIAGLRALYRPLESQVTMVYFDPRGMGESGPIREDADMGLAAVRADFDALRRHLGQERVHAIGWSNGAMNLLFLASERPETLASAIFVHGAASFTEEDFQEFAKRFPELMRPYAEVEAAMNDPALSDAAKTERQREMWLGKFFPLSCFDPEAGETLVRKAFEEASFNWRHAWWAGKEAPTFDARDRLAAITVPSLIVAGAHDMFPVAKAEEMQRGITSSKLVVFERSGHFAPLEEPEAFREVVLSFIEPHATK